MLRKNMNSKWNSIFRKIHKLCGSELLACIRRAGATIRRTRRLPRALAKRGTKTQACDLESDQRTPKKGMNMMKVIETHDHAGYEKIKAEPSPENLQKGGLYVCAGSRPVTRI